MALIQASQRNQHQPSPINSAITKLLTTAKTINLREGVKPHERKRIQEAFDILTKLAEPPSSKTGERRESYRHFLRRINNDCGPQMVIISAVGLGQSTIASMREHDRLRLPLEIKENEKALKSPILQTLAEEYTAKVPSSVHGTTENQTAIALQASQQTADTPLPQPTKSDQSAAPEPSSPDTREQPHTEYSEASNSTPLSGVAKSKEGFKEQQLQGEQTNSFSGRVFQLTLQDVQAIIMSDQIRGEVWLTEPHRNHSFPFMTIAISKAMCDYFSAQRYRLM